MSKEITGPSVNPTGQHLMVASTGGHLEQLFIWSKRWGIPTGAATWVTFDTEQSRSLLAGERVEYVPYISPRDIQGTIRAARVLSQILHRDTYDTVVSTGAAIAVSVVLATLGTRTRFLYIESLARVRHLSLTGKLIQRVPGVERYVQSPHLASKHFLHGESILDNFQVNPSGVVAPASLNIFVTVGTIRPYGFDRLIKHVESIVDESDGVIWQIGESSYRPKIGEIYQSLSREGVIKNITESDVVVIHAGVGSILSCLSNGKVPVVAARRAECNEHVDDHQRDILDLLARDGLVLPLAFDSNDREILVSAASLRSSSSA